MIIEEKISPFCSQTEENSNSAGNSNDVSKSNASDEGSSSNEKEIVSSLNKQMLTVELKEDRKRVNAVRTQFYALNEQFERMLNFKPISRIQLWTLEFDVAATYQVFASIRMEERTYSLQDQIKQLEDQLDLKDYYDIKRPTVVFFSTLFILINRQLHLQAVESKRRD